MLDRGKLIQAYKQLLCKNKRKFDSIYPEGVLEIPPDRVGHALWLCEVTIKLYKDTLNYGNPDDN